VNLSEQRELPVTAGAAGALVALALL